jgi:hypothetical protein
MVFGMNISPATVLTIVILLITSGLLMRPRITALFKARAVKTESPTSPRAEPINIERHRQIFCRWLSGAPRQHSFYDRNKAEADLDIARRFLGADTHSASDPLTLKDDVEREFTNLLQESDSTCLLVLSEFKRAIIDNVATFSVLSSFVVAIVALVNMTLSTSVDFYSSLPASAQLLFSSYDLDREFLMTREFINSAIFGCISCIAGFFLILFLYRTDYSPCQIYNSQQMSTYIAVYLGDLNDNFRQAHGNAHETILEEKDVDEMRRDATLWVTNLQWMAFRAFILERYLGYFLRQIHSVANFYLFAIPIVFVVVIVTTSYAFSAIRLSVADQNLDLYHRIRSILSLRCFFLLASSSSENQCWSYGGMSKRALGRSFVD